MPRIRLLGEGLVMSRRRRVLVGALVATVILAAVALVAAGNFLVDFALNPNASYTMLDMMNQGDVSGLGDYNNRSLFQDADYAAEATAWFDEKRTSVSHTADDGTQLLGWELPAHEGGTYADGHTYAVACHGYVGQPRDMAKYAYHFSQLGMQVLLPAARGHERNEDTGLIQMGWQDSADLVGWIEDLVAQDPEARIILFGVSMGGAEVMMASGRELPDNVRLIIEDCGYSSVWDEFELQLGNVFGLPSFPLLNVTEALCELRADGYSFHAASAAESLRRASVPMLFIHGDVDTFVPFSMLDVNYDACASPVKEKLVVEGAGHGMSSSVNPELYWSTVDAFIEQNLT